MNSLRRWLYRPKRSDPSLLAQFYFADEELNMVAAELDGFEGRKDPERCAALVNQLRSCQARVLNIVSQMMDESIKEQRALRDFRVKFPDDVIQENLAGQLWFGAECLAAGSSIMNREVESACMRPLARALTKNLDSLRTVLRDQCLHNVDEYTDVIKENLIIFDKLFAEFELSYVSAMVAVKTAHEYDMIQEITVLFSETVQRALKIGMLTQEMIDEYDPALMFTIPRLAIISGVLIFKDGPLNPDNDPWNISEMFRPFQTLLLKIRELLGILTSEELSTLERALCSQDEPSFLLSLEEKRKQAREERRKHKKERKGSGGKGKDNTKDRKASDDNGSIESELTAKEIAERLEALALNFEATHNNNGGGNTDNSNGDVVVNPINGFTDLMVNGGSNSTGDIPSSSFLHNDTDHPISNSDSPNRRGLVADLGCVEDLYREANLDSSDMITSASSSSAYPPGNNLLVQGIHLPTTRRLTGTDQRIRQGRSVDDTHSLYLCNEQIDNHDNHHQHFLSANGTSETHDEVLMDQEDRFSLNKCDSRDSGLQSEVVSNSGSMFTISSSDSNQQILSSDSIPTPSSDQNGTDSSEDVEPHNLSTERHDDEDHNLSNRQLENSSDSSATIVCKDEQHESDSLESTPAHMFHTPDNSDASQDVEDTSISLPVNPSQEATSEQCKESESETETTSIDTSRVVEGSDGVTVDTNGSDHMDTRSCDTNSVVSKDACGDSTESLTSSVESHHSLELICDKSKCSDVATEQLATDGLNCSDQCNAAKIKDSSIENESSEVMTVNSDDSVGPSINSNSVLSGNDGSVEDGREVEGLDINVINSNELPSLSQLDSATLNSSSSPPPPPLTSPSPPLSTSPPLTTPPPPLTSTQPPPEPSTSDPNLPSSSDGTSNPVNSQPNGPGQSSSIQNKETPQHSSETTFPTEQVSTNDRDGTAPVNNNISVAKLCGHRKGLSSNGKSKSSKRRKNGERRSHRRGEGGAYKPTLCPHHAKMLLDAHQSLETEHHHSSDTSSYTSECGDPEEIALAIEAAESATRNQVRARFRSSSDMIHRLFVCISGVADQLQTNFAGDLRNILRCVFDMNCPDPLDTCDSDKPKDTTPLGAAYRAMSHASRTPRHRHSSLRRDPPTWLPDDQSTDCMACQVPFNFLRRRHHCRNCGKIFCSRCSSNFVPLPHFGQDKAVRICNRCFMFQVTPFTTE